jgi:hypothetical protein
LPEGEYIGQPYVAYCPQVYKKVFPGWLPQNIKPWLKKGATPPPFGKLMVENAKIKQGPGFNIT